MNTTLSERISFIQKNSKLNQTEFAGRIGISQQYLSQICNGRKTPSDRTISDICREFGCDEVWLRTGEGEPFRKETRQEAINYYTTLDDGTILLVSSLYVSDNAGVGFTSFNLSIGLN